MVAAGDGGMIRVDHADGGSLLQRSVHPISLVQKQRCDILELAEGSPWPRTTMGGGTTCSGGSQGFVLCFDEEPVWDNSFYRDFLPTSVGCGLNLYVRSVLIRHGFR
jgi:hypothetical protein